MYQVVRGNGCIVVGICCIKSIGMYGDYFFVVQRLNGGQCIICINWMYKCIGVFYGYNVRYLSDIQQCCYVGQGVFVGCGVSGNYVVKVVCQFGNQFGGVFGQLMLVSGVICNQYGIYVIYGVGLFSYGLIVVVNDQNGDGLI